MDNYDDYYDLIDDDEEVYKDIKEMYQTWRL